jgi:hypothetical protein
VKHLIVGAGATFAEALDQGHPPDRCPPLIRDFARKTWPNVYNPHPVLEAYLQELGYTEFGSDAREIFYRLEATGETNIERFLEFAWIHKDKEWKLEEGAAPRDYISGLRIVAGGNQGDPVPPLAPRWWADFLYNGIGKPLTFFMIQCFFENGHGWKDLALTKSVASRLDPGDLVLNLNYDTIFEIALDQLNQPFSYCPSESTVDQVLVCKPHGSLNMVMNRQEFTFGQPDWLGMPEPPGFRSYSGFLPPRLNKSFAQHPAAKMILAPATSRKPEEIAMWGVGLTESDVELVALYREWSRHAKRVNVINPSDSVARKASDLLERDITWFESVAAWVDAAEKG